MKFALLSLFALFTPTPDAPPAAAPTAVAKDDAAARKAEVKRPPLADVIKGMQARYEDTSRFTARFKQRFTYTVLRRTEESVGTVRFEKPGKMRWDYQSPSTKTFLVDGKALWIIENEQRTAMVNRCFQQDGLTASVSFLWGAGNIEKDFNVEWFPGQFGRKQDHHLTLLPKAANSVFNKLILVVDPETFQVRQSIVVDPQGNVNQFEFERVDLQTPIARGAFVANTKGLEVSRIPGTCRAPAEE